MLVLGIDPGTLHMGWGIVRGAGTRVTHVAHGTISPGPHLALADRLVVIERELQSVLELHQPDVSSCESIFFSRDATAAAKLGHARGVALLVCARRGLQIFEYPPARVKKTVAGRGAAGKAQIAAMVRAILRLDHAPGADAADALAVALTHLSISPSLALARASVAKHPRIPAPYKPLRRRHP